MVCSQGGLVYVASINWASIRAQPQSAGLPQRTMRLARLGYYIAKDPHLVRGVIGRSLYSLKLHLPYSALTSPLSAYYYSVTLPSTPHTSHTTS